MMEIFMADPKPITKDEAQALIANTGSTRKADPELLADALQSPQVMRSLVKVRETEKASIESTHHLLDGGVSLRANFNSETNELESLTITEEGSVRTIKAPNKDFLNIKEKRENHSDALRQLEGAILQSSESGDPTRSAIINVRDKLVNMLDKGELDKHLPEPAAQKDNKRAALDPLSKEAIAAANLPPEPKLSGPTGMPESLEIPQTPARVGNNPQPTLV
jgi:hypothetical protein